VRFGCKGNINKYFGYRVEVDLSDEYKIKMPNACVKVAPIEKPELFMTSGEHLNYYRLLTRI
jgi:hypothetical protein